MNVTAPEGPTLGLGAVKREGNATGNMTFGEEQDYSWEWRVKRRNNTSNIKHFKTTRMGVAASHGNKSNCESSRKDRRHNSNNNDVINIKRKSSNRKYVKTTTTNDQLQETEATATTDNSENLPASKLTIEIKL